MCILLIGFNPFRRKNQAETIAAIKDSYIDFKKSTWSRISTSAKNLLSQMLNKKP